MQGPKTTSFPFPLQLNPIKSLNYKNFFVAIAISEMFTLTTPNNSAVFEIWGWENLS